MYVFGSGQHGGEGGLGDERMRGLPSTHQHNNQLTM